MGVHVRRGFFEQTGHESEEDSARGGGKLKIPPYPKMDVLRGNRKNESKEKNEEVQSEESEVQDRFEVDLCVDMELALDIESDQNDAGDENDRRDDTEDLQHGHQGKERRHLFGCAGTYDLRHNGSPASVKDRKIEYEFSVEVDVYIGQKHKHK